MPAAHPFGWMAALAVLYLALLARSAWKQNQLRQFVTALVYVGVFSAALALVIAAGVWLQGL